MSIPALSLEQFLKPANVERLSFVLKIAFVLLGLAILTYFALQVVDVNNSVSDDISQFEKRRDILIKQTAGQNVLHKPQKKDYADLASKSVFGAIAPVANANANSPKKAQETKLPLSLVGVYMPHGDDPYSIIEDEKKHSQEVFMIGDRVFDVADLTAINPDSVEINRNGSRELLMLDNGVAKPSTDSGGGDTGDETQVTVDAKELDDALQNLPLLLTQARAVPYFRDGKAVGLRLFAIRSGSLFEKIGLQNGDVLKTVNGNSMADMSQALQLFQKLKDERSVSVVLERNMAPKTIQYEIR